MSEGKRPYNVVEREGNGRLFILDHGGHAIPGVDWPSSKRLEADRVCSALNRAFLNGSNNRAAMIMRLLQPRH